MAKPKELDVVVVGGGKTCQEILLLFEEYELKNFRLHIQGVADVNLEAPGIHYAREKGIFVTQDFHDLFERFPEVDLVIELTGSDKVLEEIYRTKPKKAKVIDHVGARLFWEIISLFREKTFCERKLAHAESLNITIELICHLAHELRNPLMVIGGLVRRMAKYPELPKELEEHVRIVAEQVNRLEQVMRDLTQVAKPLKLKFVPFSLNQLVEDVCREFRGLLPSEVKLETRLDPEIPEIYLDPGLIREALWQVLKNAKEALEDQPGGHILVETKMCYDVLAIVVIDNGPGMSKEILEKATLPFFTTKPQASGLGLYLAQKIVTAHGGNLYLHSDQGQGTVVAMELPLRFVELIVPPV